MDKNLSNKPSYIIGEQNAASRSLFEKTRKFIFLGSKWVELPNGAKINKLQFKRRGLGGLKTLERIFFKLKI